MNKPAAQEQQPSVTHAQMLERDTGQRLTRAVQGGLQYLLDETVSGPMKHADGVSDLKWLLRKLMVGEYTINLRPDRPQAPPDKGRALEDYDGEGDDVPEGVTKQ